MNLKALKSRLYKNPLLITPQYFQQFIDSLEEIPVIEDDEQIENDPARVRANQKSSPRYWYLRDDGIAVISVDSPLMHKTSVWEQAGYCKSYESITANFKEAHDHPDVNGIVMQYGTGGGEGAGVDDAADFIYSYKEKPVWSFIDDAALSAGQWLASTSDHTVITPSAEAGSVGVWCAHADLSKQMEELGVDITIVSSGEHKVDGHPYAPLPDDVKEKMQADVHKMRDQFATSVAEFLDLTKLRVMETEAQVYQGQDAVDIGFAHEVLKEHEFFGAFHEHIKKTSGVVRQTTEVNMSQEQKGGDNKTAADEIKEARKEAYDLGKKDGIEEGRAEGLEIASKTYAAVLGHEDAKGKSEGAIKLLSKGLNAEDVIDLLPTVASDTPASESLSKEESKKILVEAQKSESEKVVNHSDNKGLPTEQEKAKVTSISGLSRMFDDASKRGVRYGQ